MEKYLQKEGFKRGIAESKLYFKNEGDDLLILVVYVDDIIFGGSNDEMCKNCAKSMQSEFEMSMIGELSFFLGLQVSQLDKGIFLSQTKYVKEMLKKFKMEDFKPVSTPMITGCKLSKDDESPEAN